MASTQYSITPDPTGLQPSLQSDERSRAIYELYKLSTVAQDVSVLLIYYIDTVDISILPHLAEQFDVLGYKGWILADTEQKKRDLLKIAVQLHQKAGSAYAVIRALEAVGFPGVTIQENPALLLDGSWTLNGEESLSGKFWARFKISFPDPQPPADKIELIYALIDVWKNERSHLIEFPQLLVLDGTWQLDGAQVLDGFKDN